MADQARRSPVLTPLLLPRFRIMIRSTRSILTALAAGLLTVCSASAVRGELQVLFLGDDGHHRPRDRFSQLDPVMEKRGIKLTYTDDLEDLSLPNLREYDALVLYANIDDIEPTQASSLLQYVHGGGGFVPLHCATYCFRNNEDIVALMGAQFQRHGTGVFRTELVNPGHPIMNRFGGFESWDETYVHHLHNEKNRIVLAYRVDDEGREPWTWVRTHGAGRVFYTAWGHDHRTWGNAGFQNLVERGIRWAAGDDPSQAGPYLNDLPFGVPEMTAQRADVAKFEYVDVGAKIPNYPPSRRWGVQNEPLNMMQKPLPPEESMKHFVVPKGFHLELFASEPDLGGKPIAMTWDERGRLWVAETYDYPNELQPEGKGRDRIRICEDTDGDWKADKFTVFADKLSIPTTLTFHNGGVIVQDGTRTLYLRDTDGDDVADERTVMFTGWNQRDTHGGVSNFQYGLDNWIWAMQGYNTSRPMAPGADAVESELQFAAGFWRFRPDGSKVEFIRSTNNNTWGLGISEEGIIFGSTANHNPSVYMPIANRYYERVKGWAPSLVLGTIADSHLFDPVTEKVRQVDQHGGYTAGAGHALYTARTYPQEYWNRVAFVNGPTGHLVGAFVVRPNGADFQSRYSFNLLASDDEWTAPIMSEVGPDGNVWVVDWYNFIVQHNPTPEGFENGPGNAYMTDLRDKKHGRIYRLVYDQAPQAKSKSLHEAPTRQLVETLQSDIMLWRKHAQRLLVERADRTAISSLLELVRDQSVDEIGLNTAAIHALWTLKGLGALDGSNEEVIRGARAALEHPSAGVRRNAIQVQPHEADSIAAILNGGMLGDPNAQVRLAAMLAMADLPAKEVNGAGARLAKVANRPELLGDRWVSDALVAAAANNSHDFLKSIVVEFQQIPDALAERVAIVAEHHGRSAPTDSVAELIATLSAASPQVVQTIVAGMAAGWPADQKPRMTEALEQHLETLVNRLDTGGRGQLLRLASVWGSTKLAKHSEAIVADLLSKIDATEGSTSGRIDAARELVRFQSGVDSAVHSILERINAQTEPDLAEGLISSLRESNAPKLGPMLVAHLASATPRVRSLAIEMLLQRRETIPVLLGAIDSGDVQLAELVLNQRQNLTRHPDSAVRRRAERILERGGALPNADRRKVLEEFASVATLQGHATAGKLAFKKVCAKCHKHSGEGENIGPDLTGTAAHSKVELLTHILDPNQSVESNFRLYTVVTVDGRVINGMLASESRTALEFFDAEGKKTTVLREEIEEFAGTRKSLMPEGVEKELSRQQLTDLLEFLTQRGQFKPLDFAEGATVASDQGLFSGGERYIIPGWETQTFKGVPFNIADPQDGKVKNIILLHGPLGEVCSRMPKRTSVRIGQPARAIHLLSGVSGWGYPYSRHQTTSMSVEVHYEDGTKEVTEFKNGLHFADYIRRSDVPESEFAFMVGAHQMRYLAIYPTRSLPVMRIDFIKGDDQTAPIVLAATIEQ